MIRKIVTILIFGPLGVLIVLAAIANREVVTVSLDPFLTGHRAFSVTQPLFVLLLATLIIGVIVGGFATWMRQGKWRRSARHAIAEVRALRGENEALRHRLETAELASRAYPPSIPYRPSSAA